jgi:membrane fusion protein, multidrug efflux system
MVFPVLAGRYYKSSTFSGIVGRGWVAQVLLWRDRCVDGAAQGLAAELDLKMRWISQVAVVIGLAAIGAGGWYMWQQHQSGSATASPSARAAASIPAVDVLPARAGLVIERVESVGTARANESVTITAKQAGNVSAINFEEGQRVRNGATLIELEAFERKADVDQAKADLEQSRAQRDEVRQRLDRAKQLKNTGNVTDARLDELESQLRAAEGRMRATEARIRAVNARLDDLRITAPFDGRVGMRQVSMGALVQPGSAITTLDDISKIKFDFAVPEIALGGLKAGLGIVARTSAFPDRKFEGEVAVVDTRVDPVSRAVRVNAVFNNTDELLKPGMFLSVELALTRRENAVIIAEEGVVSEGAKHFVFVVKGDNKIERREIKLGQRLPGEVEVASGLVAGEVVVVRGVQKVRPGQTVAPRPLQPIS